MRCPLLFRGVVRRERIQLRGLRWELVRRLGSDASGTGPMLYWSGRRVQCPLLYGRVVRCERIQLRGLRRRLVQPSISACVQPHDEASERPQRLSVVDGLLCAVMAASEGAEQVGNEQE